jgi:hypothetical protein
VLEASGDGAQIDAGREQARLRVVPQHAGEFDLRHVVVTAVQRLYDVSLSCYPRSQPY